MEIELKYHVNDQAVADAIFESDEIKKITDIDSEETIAMKAVYYDTEDRRLSRDLMTFRIRREGARLVGTLKWNGQSDEGMHEREELNVPILDEGKIDSPDIEIFSETPMYDELRRIVGHRSISKVIEVEVIRRQVRVDTGRAICELSYDNGKVYAGNSEGVISEMEIELYSGEKEDMERLGNELAAKYGLVPENRSKYKQGLELLQK